MQEAMSLRTLHMPGWMDEELRMLAFKTKLNKAELMRRMIARSLDESWDSVIARNNDDPILNHSMPEKTSVSAKAFAALGVAA
ncbi:hypothetical protein [Loktanella sp. R86503]|uniref:hypothetical protein n=1 Tax=Loktanella sp. R86503 TaxID=3093847 RepID=UPI0036DD9079